MHEEKSSLRIEARRSLERTDMMGEDPEKAADFFFEAVQPDPSQVISAYWPKGRELDTAPILERLLEDGFTCALPVMQDKTLVMNFACWVERIAMRRGRFDIMEPDSKDYIEPDILIVPMLAFDRRGYRLGQGGGYYDSTLADLRARRDILAVGYAYASQACLFNLPTEDHDQKMDLIITPQGVHDFREKD
ncbi:MAG: 5-formyltetrahydrofolate cyclo-ligase [Pseudomonadota bacterium]